jgi:hypothetical protein
LIVEIRLILIGLGVFVQLLEQDDVGSKPDDAGIAATFGVLGERGRSKPDGG